ncbi:MAG: hypothetical protein K2K89_04125 [Ruminococcus sp.]|nr:hypothetical protein [Ruminococcus sp.]
MYIDILKQIVNNYERYKSIAVNLEWTEFNSRYYEWFNHHVGIFVTVCDFPKGYVKNNFEQAYVQTVLTYMAYSEEFKEDFRNTPSDELLKYMTQAKDFYAIYMTYEELRMKSVTEDYLIQQIKWHTGDDDIPESEINSVIPYLVGAENIEIGGCFCCYDHTFISIKDNSIMIIECEIWD